MSHHDKYAGLSQSVFSEQSLSLALGQLHVLVISGKVFLVESLYYLPDC